jgi:Domain of unknown function (DUF397)
LPGYDTELSFNSKVKSEAGEVRVTGSGERVQGIRARRPGAGTGGAQEECPGTLPLAWRKSSWSAYNGNCVEVAGLGAGLIAVRDTKQLGTGPVLCFDQTAWDSFLAGVKNGDFRR